MPKRTHDKGIINQHNVSYFDSDWSLHEYSREVGLRDIEAHLLEEFFPRPPAAVLDIGCGAGRTTTDLAHRGYRVKAIDLSETLLGQARRRYPELEFMKMDATALDFPDNSFDGAFFSYNGIDCIYPVESRIACMRETFRILKPGGTFMMSTHNFVGAVFSGGYYYLRGYWNAFKTLAAQLRNPFVYTWYFLLKDEGGALYVYSAPPIFTVRQLQKVGFQVVAVRGAEGESGWRSICMHQKHVHFVAKKT